MQPENINQKHAFPSFTATILSYSTHNHIKIGTTIIIENNCPIRLLKFVKAKERLISILQRDFSQ
jgi:hypothetical protein